MDRDGPSAVVDRIAGATGCRLSDDGWLWYEPRGAEFAPIAATRMSCSPQQRSHRVTAIGVADAPLPTWAHPRGVTQALFVAGTLQDDLSRPGTREMSALARGSGIPMTWMLGNAQQLALNADVYDRGHRRYGDDLQVEPYDDLARAVRKRFPWFTLTTTIDGGGHERDVAHDQAMHARAFWGIAWNSSGVDGIADRGTPWGTYCADAQSYKRPSPSGSCALIGVEWTARDLTRSYFTSHEEAYSTDPDDLEERAGLHPLAAGAYARQIVDAYAAAGEERPLVMIAQQESAGAGADPLGTFSVLSAMYDEVRRDGMHALTMSDAVGRARGFAATPRAVAFPFIPGLPDVYGAAPSFDPTPFPATIDYVDTRAAMTFVAGRAFPVREFPFAADTVSRWNRQLDAIPAAEMPALTGVASDRERRLVLRVYAPLPMHTGIAFWADPHFMRWKSRNVVAAGRAGSVAIVDLPGGESNITLRCEQCSATTFPLSP